LQSDKAIKACEVTDELRHVLVQLRNLFPNVNYIYFESMVILDIKILKYRGPYWQLCGSRLPPWIWILHNWTAFS